MWITHLLLILLGISLGEAQKSSSSKLESRVSQMLEWNKRNSVIKLSSEKFNTYVKSKPRNYSVVAMLTALKPQRECSVCQDANDEYNILANSYHYSNAYSNRLFFVMVDIDEDGYEVFQWLRLTTAPTYYHFPPTGKRKPEDRFDVGRVGYQADALAKWVAERTSIQITIMRPPNYTMLTLWAAVVIVVLVFAYWRRENLSIVYNSQNWAFLAILIILYMISGQMWNHIRGPPVAHRNPHTGEVGYFSGTSQYQFVAETYIIMALYGSITVGVILMNKELSFPFIEGAIQKGSYMVGLAIVVLVFGYTLSIFRMKYQGYPYSFIFK